MLRESTTGRFSATTVKDRIQKLVQVDEETGCWLWQGYTNERGYGLMKDAERRTRIAHRLSYETFVGPIPEGLQLDHLCRVRHCLNPTHLEPVTGKTNVRRGESPAAQNARRTHCVHGHEFTPANTYWWRGGRICRECGRIRLRKKRAHQRASNRITTTK